MKHAGPATIAELEPLIAQIRALPELREKTPGVFYRKSRAYLHFHEDPKGVFADVRAGDDFERMDVTDEAGRAVLMARLRAELGPAISAGGLGATEGGRPARSGATSNPLNASP